MKTLALVVAVSLLIGVPGPAFYAGAAELTAPAASRTPLPTVIPALPALGPSFQVLQAAPPSPQDLDALRQSFASLPEDPYRGPAPGTSQHAAARLEVSREAGGGIRIRMAPGALIGLGGATARYPGIPWEAMRNPAFQARIAALFDGLPKDLQDSGVEIGVHAMRVIDGQVHPSGFHQDHFGDFIATWVVGRDNAKGGRTILAADADGRQAVFEKENGPEDLVLFDNRALYHTVTPIERLDPARPSVRDVFAFSVAPLPPSTLSAEERAELSARASAELSKPLPDAGTLKSIYERADSRLRSLLLLAFRHWSLYFHADAAQWSFLKAATAPWASRVYTVELRSFLQDLQERMGRQLDAAKAADAAHKAAIHFSQTFVEQAEKDHPQGLDRGEAALAVADEALFATFVRPIMDHRQVGAYDRAAGRAELARRIKDTVYLYSPDMTLEKIEQLLDSPGMREQLERFLATVEPFAEPAAQAPPQAPPQAPQPRAAPARTGARAALSLLALLAGVHLLAALTPGAHLAWAATMLVAGSLAATPPSLAPAAPAPERPSALIDKTEEARQGRLSPIYLRDAEIDTAIEVLNKTAQNNVFLVGEPGVGKTGIIDGLAQRMADGQTGTPLDGQRLLLLDIGEFLASAAGSPDAFAHRVSEIVAEASDGRTVLAIDEGHQLARDPNTPAMMMSFFDQVKRPMTEGRFKLIVATTREEYRRYFSSDAALESRSTILNVEPVEPKAAAGVLYRLRGRYERGLITIPFAAAKAAVDYALRAYRFKALMRMAVDALDSAATRLIYGRVETERRLFSLRRDLLHDLSELKQARAEGDRVHEENLIETLRPRLEEYLRFRRQYDQSVRATLDPSDVESALRARGAPLSALNEGSVAEMERIEKLLRARYIGHPEVIDRVMEALRRRFADPNSRRPKFSAVLLGPTGVGKTELARLLGEALFGETDIDKSLIRYNGGELQNKGDITKITGAPPSFVGFGETETLMDKVREKPESVILFDEIEKAHPDILNLLLSILEDGSATDSKGRLVDFSHTVIVLTSNYGVPTGYETMEPAAIKAAIDEALRKPVYNPHTNASEPRFKPEFLNRPDLVEVMGTLSPDDARAIAALRLAELKRRWHQTHGVELIFPDEAGLVGSLMKDGYSPRNGARELKRALLRDVEDPLNRRLADLSRPLRRGEAVAIAPDFSLQVSKAPDEGSPRIKLDGPEGQALAERLETLLAAPSLNMDELDAALDGERPAAASRAAGPSFELREHTPKKTDPALAPALDSLGQAAGQADAEWLLPAAKALIQKAKRLDLEAAKRRVEGDRWRQRFYDADKSLAVSGGKRLEAAKEDLTRAVAQANREGAATVSWSAEGEPRLEIRSNARLTLEEDAALRRLFTRAAKAEEGTDNADDELAVQLAAAYRHGARAGYAGDAASTTLWLEWSRPKSAPAAPVEPPKPAAQAEPEKAPEPEPAAVETEQAVRVRGVVKWFNETKGFGFISYPDGEIFMAGAALRDASDARRLQQDMPVEFTVAHDRKMLSARDVVIVGVGPAEPAAAAPASAGPWSIPVTAAPVSIGQKDSVTSLTVSELGQAPRQRWALRDLDLRLYRAGYGPDSRTAAQAFARAMFAWPERRKFNDESFLKWRISPTGTYVFLFSNVSNPEMTKSEIFEVLAAQPQMSAAARAGGVLHLYNTPKQHYQDPSTFIGLTLPAVPAPAPAGPGEARYYVDLAAKLANSDTAPQAVFDHYDTLSKMLAERPQLASPELAETLLQRMDLALSELGELPNLVSVAGQSQPERPLRNIFELYEQLVRARPDLISPDLPLVLERSMADPIDLSAEQAQAALWFSQRCAGIAQAVAAVKPGAESAELAASMTWLAVGHYRNQPGRRALKPAHRFLRHDFWITPLLTVAGLIVRAVAQLHWSLVWQAPLAFNAAAGLILGAIALARWRAWRARWNPVRVALESAATESFRRLDAETRLRLAGDLDYESETWGPKPGAERVYAELAKDEDFRKAAAQTELRPRPDLDLGRVSMEMAAAKTNQEVLRLSKTISLTLAADPQKATPLLEETLRGLIAGFVGQLGKRSDAYGDSTNWKLSWQDQETASGTRMPGRVVREAFDLYEKMALARPDLIPAGFPDPTLVDENIFTTTNDQHGNEVAAWTFKRLIALSQAVAEKHPSTLPLGHSEALASAATRVRQRFELARWNAVRHSLIWSAIVVGAIYVITCLGIGPADSGAHWATPHGRWAAPHAFLAMELIGLPWAAITALSQWWRVKTFLRYIPGTQRRAQEILYRQARASDPRAVLEVIATFDYEHERWKPNQQHAAVFHRLAKEWPAFAQAAAKR